MLQSDGRVIETGLGPIQVIPPGLTGLLQLKQTGRVPSTLLEDVRGVIELRDWYLTARRVDVAGLVGGQPSRVTVTGQQGFAVFTTNPVTVPSGQLWYVEQATVVASGGLAADTIRFAFGIVSPAPANAFQQVGPDVNDVVTGRTRFLSTKADRGFWAFPGDSFQTLAYDVVSAGGWTLAMAARVTICPI